ncbi:MAG TPA: ATP-binding protein [Burkholderiaceae bacterium]|nr:ATP-binding protein [Burkholderiaceae bacterium]
MPYIPRLLSPQIQKAARTFPAVLITGPRQCGKTTLLRHLYPQASYVLLEDPDVLARVRADPRAFIESLRPPVVLDEIQNAPELFSYLRTRIDAAPGRKGRWLLTGSQEAPLMRGVAESMAGRVAVLHLLPFSTVETPKVSQARGGYPGVVGRPSAAQLWFRSYVQTYLERDVRAVTAVRDLATFRRFLALLAMRIGTVLNRTDLAAPLGVTVPTLSDWLDVLEVTGQILRVPPFFENFGKRLIKSPKLYFVDSGLACHLLGIDSPTALRRSPFAGPVFEGFVAAEIAKQQVNRGGRADLYYFRDQQGLEVDFIVPTSPGGLAVIEAKASRTVTPTMARPLTRLTAAIERYDARAFVVHEGGAHDAAGRTLAPGVSAVTVPELLGELGRAPG